MLQQRQQTDGRGQRLDQPRVQPQIRAAVEFEARESRSGLAQQRQMDGADLLAPDELEFLQLRRVFEEAQ